MLRNARLTTGDFTDASSFCSITSLQSAHITRKFLISEIKRSGQKDAFEKLICGFFNFVFSLNIEKKNDI